MKVGKCDETLFLVMHLERSSRHKDLARPPYMTVLEPFLSPYRDLHVRQNFIPGDVYVDSMGLSWFVWRYLSYIGSSADYIGLYWIYRITWLYIRGRLQAPAETFTAGFWWQRGSSEVQGK